MLFVLAGMHVYAQQDAKIIAEIAAGNEKMVKNAPFSAEAVSESVQTLADGNRIVRTGMTKLYRNSDGRFRREFSGNAGSGFGGTFFTYGSGISILDPVAGQRIMLEPTQRTARVVNINGGQGFSIVTTSAPPAVASAQRADVTRKAVEARNMTETERAGYAAKAKEYAAIATKLHLTTVTASSSDGTSTVSTYNGTPGFIFPSNYLNEKYETRTEELGTRDFEGTLAEGTKKITTIPAGAIGNERPIEIIYERWYSKDLELVVYSKQSDPRVGDQTYRLTNLIRSEPDSSLFSVPQGYRVLAEPASVFRLSTSRPLTNMGGARSPAAAAAPATVNVKNTKP